MANQTKYSKPLEVKSIPIRLLKPATYNPRTIDKKSFTALKNAIADFGQRENLIVNKDYTVISGHQRLEAMVQLGYTEAMCDVVELSKDDEKKLNLIMNSPLLAGQFDTLKVDELLHQLRLSDDLVRYRLPQLGTLDLSDGDAEQKRQAALNSLLEQFGAVPFSIIDTRQERWLNRRRAWLDLGLKGEVGRQGNLVGAGSERNGYGSGWDKSKGENVWGGPGTSIFDPALCEVLYTWFNQPAGAVLDPFAGAAVRGIVAHKLGMPYTGIELRGEQVAANRQNCQQVFKKPPSQLNPPLRWLEGDSNVLLDEIDGDYNFLFSCPPYANLEVYSQHPADISNMPYGQFLEVYRSIIAKACAKLANNSFACFVVSEVRSGNGAYYNFVADTVDAFEAAGMFYYNELILINSHGSLPLRAGRLFNASRKIGRTHQNILVFYKGNPKQIKQHYPPLDLRQTEPTKLSTAKAKSP